MAILPKVKLKALVNFPPNVESANFITIIKNGAVYTVGADYTKLSPLLPLNLTNTIIVGFDTVTGAYGLISVDDFANGNFSEQHITGPGPVVIGTDTSLVRVDQTIGAPITLQIQSSATKTCPVLISDWKGDAGTNNITISLTGTDKFPGNLTSWKIAADAGSVLLKPVPGVGYVL